MQIKCITEVIQWHYSSSITIHEQKKEIVGSLWKFLRSGSPSLSLAKFILSFNLNLLVVHFDKTWQIVNWIISNVFKVLYNLSPLLNIWHKFNIFHQFTFRICDLQSEYREAHANCKPTVLPNRWSPWWYEPWIAFWIT